MLGYVSQFSDLILPDHPTYTVAAESTGCGNLHAATIAMTTKYPLRPYSDEKEKS